MKRDLKEFVRINHHLMTVKEMAAEIGEKDYQIRDICDRYGWKAISNADRIRYFIKENPNAIIEDVAEKFDCGVANVNKLAKEMGIDTLVTRKHAEAIGRLPDRQLRSKYSLMHHALEDGEGDKDKLKERLKIILGSDSPIRRVKESYNQSRSPFGLADRLRGIQTK